MKKELCPECKMGDLKNKISLILSKSKKKKGGKFKIFDKV